AADARVMLAVWDGGVVLHSWDDGASWELSMIPGAADLRGVAMDPEALRVLAVDASGSVWSSSDAGAHFTREASAKVSLNAVAMADGGELAIAVGDGCVIIERTADALWHAAPSGTALDLRAAVIMDDGRRYVAGDSGTLLASSDGGATWDPVAVATRATFYGVDDL
ncbi:MAG: WD40/YVTN/BNR-like repeat-containing protein, partial [Polyangiaceae bacterium]